MIRRTAIALLAFGLTAGVAAAAAHGSTSLKYKNRTARALEVEVTIGGGEVTYRVPKGKSLTIEAVDDGSCAHVRFVKGKTRHRCSNVGSRVKAACDVPNDHVCLSRVVFDTGQLRITVSRDRSRALR